GHVPDTEPAVLTPRADALVVGDTDLPDRGFIQALEGSNDLALLDIPEAQVAVRLDSSRESLLATGQEHHAPNWSSVPFQRTQVAKFLQVPQVPQVHDRLILRDRQGAAGVRRNDEIGERPWGK